MSVFQTLSLAASTVKVRWQEPYVTSGLNEKSIASNPRGIVYGLRVVPTVGYSVQILEDPTLGYSIANVNDTSGAVPFSVSVLQPGSLFLDLTAQANTVVFLVLDAQYTVGGASAAQVRVVDAAELVTNLDLVVIAKVSVPAAPPLLLTHINMGYAQLSGAALPLPALPLFNMVFNSSFEADSNAGAAAGWTSTGTPTVTCSTDFARTGTKSLKINIGAPGVATVLSGPMPVLPGEEYNLGAWFRTNGGGITGTGLQLQAIFYDKAFAPIGLPTDIETPVTGVVASFTQRLARVTAPALAAHAKIQVSIDGATTGVGYMDDVLFAALHADTIAHSAVFGGSGVIADQYHAHAAAGLNYAGGPPWADGTTNPATTIEAQIDKIISDLAGASGAPKVGNAPSKILNNVFVNTVPNTASIDATGKGTGVGVIGRGEPGTDSIGVHGFGSGIGQAGIVGFGGTNNGTYFVTSSNGGFFVGGSGSAGGNGLYSIASSAGRYGVYAAAFGTGGVAVYADGQGTNTIGVQGFGRGTGSGGTFRSGTDSTSGTAALSGLAQGANSKGVWATSTGTEPAYYGTTVGGNGITVLVTAGNGAGGNFTGFGSGNGVTAQGGATGSGVSAQGGASGGYGIYAKANGGNTPGVFGQGKGSTGAIVAQGDPGLVGTHVIRPNGFGGGGGDGAATGNTTSHGGDGLDVQGGSCEFLPAPTSSTTPYPRGSAGHGVIGRAGSGRVAGHGVYGFGGVGYYNGIDPITGPGYGVFGQGHNSDGQGGVIASADAGHGVIGVGGDSSFFQLAGHGVTGKNGTDSDVIGGDGACFYATPSNSIAKALLIEGNTGAIAYATARPMQCILMGAAFTGLSEADRGNTQGTLSFDDTQGLIFNSTGTPSEFRGYAQFRLPLNAVVTSATLCLVHGGAAHYAGSFFRISKQFPSGTSIGGTTGGVTNDNTINASFNAGAGAQTFTLTNGTLGERTVTAVDQAFTVFFEIQALDSSGDLTVKYLKINYNMFDYLYLV